MSFPEDCGEDSLEKTIKKSGYVQRVYFDALTKDCNESSDASTIVEYFNAPVIAYFFTI